MKRVIRIISFVLIFVICLSSFSFAYATESGDFVSSYDFWGWIADHTQAFWDILGFPNVFSSASDSCSVSDDHLHHASSGTPYRTSGSLSGGNMVFSCHCDYCGMLFDATMPYNDYLDKSKAIYDEYVGNTPTTGGESAGTFGGRRLPVTGIDSDGALYFSPHYNFVELGVDRAHKNVYFGNLDFDSFPDFDMLDYYKEGNDFTFPANTYIPDLDVTYYLQCNFNDSPLTLSLSSSESEYTVNFLNVYAIFSAPISGEYSLVNAVEGYSSSGYLLSNSFEYTPERGNVQSNFSISGFSGQFGLLSYQVNETLYICVSPYEYVYPMTSYIHGTSARFTIPTPVYKIIPSTGAIDPATDATYNIDGRATSFTGDLGIMGDNGTLTKVEGDQIFNETTNYYHNPVTNNTTNITDWIYDYSDRSYHLTTEEGDTVTVTYGDENITIQEGDQTYNVYYIITNEGGGSQGGGGEGGGGEATDPTHTHSWGEPTDSTPPTCTAPGSKTYTCSECGETKTETVPATGHKWVVKQTVQTKYDESGQLVQEGYTLYECSVCGEQYKSTDGTGPPGGSGSGSGGGSGDDGGESIWDKLGKLFGTLGSGLLDLLGAVVGKLLDGLISLAELMAEKLVDVVNLVLGFFDEIPKLFTGFLGFLTAIFPFLPPDIMLLLTFGIAAIVFIGIIKAVRR